MTATVETGRRPECVSCTRPMGRRRPLLVDWGEPLFVCDVCWHLAGGREAVAARAASPEAVPWLQLDPAAELLLAGAICHDELHPLDRMLTEAGIRWSVLRHIVPAARAQLALTVLARTAPEHTRRADGPAAWFAHVEGLIATSREFRYNSKRRRYWRICRVFALCADRQGRPLTWSSQEEVAAAVGCSTKTVQRCVHWLQREGVFFELVPGCRLPMMEAPEGETAEERERRRQALTAAIVAEEAARRRAEAELAAVDDGHLGAEAAAIAAEASHRPPVATPASGDDSGQDERPLANLCPVYELRVPLSEPERIEAEQRAQLSAGHELLRRHAAERVHPANFHLYCEVTAVYASGAHTMHDPLDPAGPEPCAGCGPVVGYLRDTPLGADLHNHENVHPPQVFIKDQNSQTVRPVDKRRAPRGSDHRGSAGAAAHRAVDGSAAGSKGHRKARRASRAQRFAEQLIRGLLHPAVCEGVAIRKLAAAIRGSKLLDHGWTVQDIADHLHGLPTYPQLPREIRDPWGRIKRRFALAIPQLPPSKLTAIAEVEDRLAATRARHRQAALRRAAINACALCDEHGWLNVDDPDVDAVRCSHDPPTGGW